MRRSNDRYKINDVALAGSVFCWNLATLTASIVDPQFSDRFRMIYMLYGGPLKVKSQDTTPNSQMRDTMAFVV